MFCFSSGETSTEADDTDEDSNVMPTGQVVGVTQRNWREYVAAFAEDEVRYGLQYLYFDYEEYVMYTGIYLIELNFLTSITLYAILNTHCRM